MVRSSAARLRQAPGSRNAGIEPWSGRCQRQRRRRRWLPRWSRLRASAPKRAAAPAPEAGSKAAPAGAAGSDLSTAVRYQTSGQLPFCSLCVDPRLTTECLRTIRGLLELAEFHLPTGGEVGSAAGTTGWGQTLKIELSKHFLRVLPKLGRGFRWHGRGRPEPQR